MSRPTVVIGTRAQLIKTAPVLARLEALGAPYRLLFTGQHRVTMDALLADFGVTTAPEYLYDGPEIAGVGQMARWGAGLLATIERDPARWFGAEVKDSTVVVHGDTVSTLIGALAGRRLGARVAHVESGLRSFDLRNPFPEELTRLAVFRLMDVAYCPGAWAAGNLAKYRNVEIVDTGANTILDAVRAALATGAKVETDTGTPYAVVSLHRFENLSRRERLEAILADLRALAGRYAVRLCFVLHPVTEKTLARYGLLEGLRTDARFDLRPRMGYFDFVQLLGGARFVVSDGGSNQEELSLLGVPTVLMREATERHEGLVGGDTGGAGNVLLSRYRRDAMVEFLDARLQVPAQRAAWLDAGPAPAETIARHLLAGAR